MGHRSFEIYFLFFFEQIDEFKYLQVFFCCENTEIRKKKTILNQNIERRRTHNQKPLDTWRKFMLLRHSNPIQSTIDSVFPSFFSIASLLMYCIILYQRTAYVFVCIKEQHRFFPSTTIPSDFVLLLFRCRKFLSKYFHSAQIFEKWCEFSTFSMNPTVGVNSSFANELKTYKNI